MSLSLNKRMLQQNMRGEPKGSLFSFKGCSRHQSSEVAHKFEITKNRCQGPALDLLNLYCMLRSQEICVLISIPEGHQFSLTLPSISKNTETSRLLTSIVYSYSLQLLVPSVSSPICIRKMEC